jgi:hypothetical protein
LFCGTATDRESEETIMNDGSQPNYAPNQAPPKAGGQSSDQMIGDATSVISSFFKDTVGAVRLAWDQKKIIMALIVAVVLVVSQFLYSILSMWGVKLGSILGSWVRTSVLHLVALALLALVGMLLVGGKSSGGIIGALSGVGAAALPIAAGLLVRTVFLLIVKILPFWLFQQINNLIATIFGTPMYVAMFVLLALAIRRMTKSDDDFAVARNTVLLTMVYFVAAYIIGQILWA